MSAAYEIVVLDVGGAALAIPFQRAGQADPEQVGGLSRAYAGNQYSSIIEEYMVVPLVSARVSSAIYAQVKAMFAKGAQIPCQAGAAGNVFEGVTSIVKCSGKVTGEMVPGVVGPGGKPPWIINLTLTEVGTALAGAPVVAAVYLTNVTSPDDPGSGLINLATALSSEDTSPYGAMDLLDLATPATCGTTPDPTVNCPITYTDPSAPEKVWLTAATVTAGYLTGVPTVRLHSTGDTYDRWQAQESRADIIVVRGGVDVATFSTGYSASNGGFAGSDIDMNGTASIIFASQVGDRFRIELFGRLGLHGGYADNGNRQHVSFGYLGAGTHWGQLLIQGLAALLNP